MLMMKFFNLLLIYFWKIDKKNYYLRTNVNKLWAIKCRINFVKIHALWTTNFTNLCK